MTIDPNRVEAILRDALSGDETAGVRFEGIAAAYQLDPDKLAKHRGEIVELLAQLPDEFMDNGGGGWSFLNLCQTKRGELWTGMQQTCERLIALAAGLDLAAYMMPREVWEAMPGGVPYVVVKRSAFEAVPA